MIYLVIRDREVFNYITKEEVIYLLSQTLMHNEDWAADGYPSEILIFKEGCLIYDNNKITWDKDILYKRYPDKDTSYKDKLKQYDLLLTEEIVTSAKAKVKERREEIKQEKLKKKSIIFTLINLEDNNTKKSYMKSLNKSLNRLVSLICLPPT